MNRNAIADAALRALGGVLGVSILIGFAFAMARFVGGAVVPL